MSNTEKRPYAEAKAVADKIIRALEPHSSFIEVAGSLRRLNAQIGDIEIVAVPTGEEFYVALDQRIDAGTITHIQPKRRWGRKQRTFTFAGWNVDLFIQPDPATLPVNMMIRTGSAFFSQKMVTKKSRNGWMPDWYDIEDARVWFEDRPVDLHDERELFSLWGIDYVEPQNRTDKYRPAKFTPVRPRHREPLFDDQPVQIEPVTAKRFTAPIQAARSEDHFDFDSPLPERFSGWNFTVSPDAGTPAARSRRASEVRKLYANLIT